MPFTPALTAPAAIVPAFDAPASSPAAPEGVPLSERRSREAALAELVRLSEEMGGYDL